MNYVDLIILGIIGLFLIIGLFTKFWKNFFILLTMVASVPIAYLLSGMFVTSKLGEAIVEKVKQIEIIKSMAEASDAFASLLQGSGRMILFFILGISLFVISFLVGAILFWIFSLFFKGMKEKKHKISLLSGLSLALTGAVIALFIASPLMIINKPVTEAVSYYEEKEETDGKLYKAVKTIDNLNNESFIAKAGIKLLDKNGGIFLKYQYKNEETGETKEYNLYTDMAEASLAIKPGLNVLEMFKDMDTSSIDFSDSESIKSLLNSLHDVLKEVDTFRGSLDDEAHFKNLISELVEYYLSTYPEGLSNDNKLAFLKNAKNYLTDFNYLTSDYADTLPQVILQSYIDQMETSQKVLEYVDITEFTFDEITGEVDQLPVIMKLMDKGASLTKDEVKGILTESKIMTQVMDGVLSDYYTDGSITRETLDFDKEAEAISLIFTYANNDDNNIADSAVLVLELKNSDLLPALINFYNTNEDTTDDIKVVVSDPIQLAAIEAALYAEYTGGGLTQQQFLTYKDAFVSEK